jgi:hypothetical protein
MTAMSADNWVMGHGNEQLEGGKAFFKRVGPRVPVAVVVSAVAAIVVWNIVRLVQGQTTAAQLACVDPTMQLLGLPGNERHQPPSGPT